MEYCYYYYYYYYCYFRLEIEINYLKYDINKIGYFECFAACISYCIST